LSKTPYWAADAGKHTSCRRSAANQARFEPLYQHFGAYIKEHRLELNLSQAPCRKIVIDRALLSRIETGKKELNADITPACQSALPGIT
jgi:hypothetical protein